MSEADSNFYPLENLYFVFPSLLQCQSAAYQLLKLSLLLPLLPLSLQSNVLNVLAEENGIIIRFHLDIW